MKIKEFRALDCQGLAGGLTLGFAGAGFELVGKVEQEGGFGTQSVEANQELLSDRGFPISQGKATDWPRYKRIDLVFGNPPCSGFSNLRPASFAAVKRERGFNNKEGWSPGVKAPINSCMWDLFGYAALHKPTIVVMESVQAAYKVGGQLMTALVDLLKNQTGKRYQITHVLQNAASLGGIADRPRYFLVASCVPFGIDEPEGMPGGLLRDALVEAKAGVDGHWTCDEMGLEIGHISRLMALMDLAEAKGVPWLQGMATPDVLDALEGVKADTSPWYRDYSASNGHSRRDRLSNFRADNFALSRWQEDRLARVVTGKACRDVIHPTERRMITVREQAAIMGFPSDWIIDVPGTRPWLRMNWHGKGVSVPVADWIGYWCHRALERDPGPWRGEVIGGERVIDFTSDWKAHFNNKTGEWEDCRSYAWRKRMETRFIDA